jgi:hypothetical protein
MELVCSILNGVQMTLKEALIDHAIIGGNLNTIKVQDF